MFIGVAANNFQLKKKRREEIGKQRFSTFNVHGSEIGACQNRSVLGPAACGLWGWGQAGAGLGTGARVTRPAWSGEPADDVVPVVSPALL